MKKRFFLLPLLLLSAVMARGQGEEVTFFSEGYFDYRFDDYYGGFEICQSAPTLPADLYIPSRVSYQGEEYGVTIFSLYDPHPEVKTIHFPASMQFVSFNENTFPNLLNYEVEEGCSRYQSIDGVLVEGGKLIGWPQGRKGVCTIPEGVTSVDYQAGLRNNGIISLFLPSTLTSTNGLPDKKIWVMRSATPPGLWNHLYNHVYVPSEYLSTYQEWAGENSQYYVHPFDAIVDDMVYLKTDEGKMSLVTCLRSLKEENMVVIPAQVQVDDETFTVTQIADRAFYDNMPAVMELPATIESIGEYALTPYNRRSYVIMDGVNPPQLSSQYKWYLSFLVKNEAYENYTSDETWQEYTISTYEADVLVDGVCYTQLEDGSLEVSRILREPKSGFIEIPSTVIVGGMEKNVTSINVSSGGRMIVLPETLNRVVSTGEFSYVMFKGTTPPTCDYKPDKPVLVPAAFADSYASEGWTVLAVDGWTDEYVYGYYSDGVAIHAWLKELDFEKNMDYNTIIISIPSEIEGQPVRSLSRSLFDGSDGWGVNIGGLKIKLPASIQNIDERALAYYGWENRNITVFTSSRWIEYHKYDQEIDFETATVYGKRELCESYPWSMFGTKVICDAVDDQFVYANHYSEEAPADPYYYDEREPDGLTIIGSIANAVDHVAIPEAVAVERSDYYYEEPQMLPVVAIADSALRAVHRVYIDEYGSEREEYLTSMTIPANIREIGVRGLPILGRIGVRPSNDYFKVGSLGDAALLSKDGTTLVQQTSYDPFRSYGVEGYNIWEYRNNEEYRLNGVERILPGAFDGCYLEFLGLPASVKEISGDALALADIGELAVDENNENFCIYDGALLSADRTRFIAFPHVQRQSYDKLEMPAEVQTIDDRAFGLYGCSLYDNQWEDYSPSLNSLYVQSEVPPVVSETTFTERMYQNTKLVVPAASLDAYTNTEPWSRFRSISSMSIDEGDFQLLKDFYAAMNNGEGWHNKWEFGETADQTKGLYGVRFMEGHATTIDLSSNGLQGTLSGELFRLPQLQTLNLSNNQLEGDIATIVPADATSSPVTTLNLSHNKLTGNVGPLGEQLPSLTSLDVSYNHLTEVIPILPTSISSLTLNNQTMDAPFDYAQLLEPIDPEGELPSLLFYNHQGQSYIPRDPFTLRSDGWSMNLKLNYDTYLLQPENTGNSVFRHAEGTTATLSTANSSTAKVNMKFDMGDVDFDTFISVADLQLTVNHALDKSLGGLFNYTAANIIEDDLVNVQDVVCLVNLLLNPPMSRLTHRAPALGTAADDVADARLFWRGNELVLQTEREVGAIDLTLADTEHIEWLPEGDEGYSHAMSHSGDGLHVIHYSMSGRTIATGETVLARATGRQPRVSRVMMVDEEARRISVAVEGTATGISDVDSRLLVSADRQQVTVSTGRELTRVSWSAYDLSGTLLGQGHADRWAAGHHSLPIAANAVQQVVLRLKSDQQQLTKKININN